jgi:hypothetical protein
MFFLHIRRIVKTIAAQNLPDFWISFSKYEISLFKMARILWNNVI